MIHRIATGLAIAYALAMAVMVFFLTRMPDTLAEVVFVIVMIVWTSLPVTGLLLLKPRSRTALIIAALGIVFAGYAYFDIMVINLDPQSALGLIFVPIYQLALAAAAWGLGVLVRLVLRRAAK